MTGPDHRLRALQHWRIPAMHLAEARAINTELAPSAAIARAYFAMFHAAHAVITQHDGPNAADTHRGIVARYGMLLQATEQGRGQARALHRAGEARMATDYGDGPRPAPEDVRTVVESAVEFLRFNAAAFGFPLE